MPNRVKVEGLQEIEKRLIAMGSVNGTKALKSAMYYAFKPTLDLAKAKVPVRSGSLRDSLTRGFTSARRSTMLGFASGSRFQVSIYPKSKKKSAVNLYNNRYKKHAKRIRHGHLIEFGWKPKYRASFKQRTYGGWRGGISAVPARPFLGPALRATSQTIVDRFSGRIGKSMERIAAKGR